MHERAWVKTSAFAVEVKILAETRNRRHSRELFKMLRANYEVRRPVCQCLSNSPVKNKFAIKTTC